MNKFFQGITEKNEERTIPEKSYYDPIKKQKLVILDQIKRKKSYCPTTEDEN